MAAYAANPDRSEMMADAVITNQKTIVANQKAILSNQKSILANHGAIRKNQKALDAILSNQKEILKNQKEILGRSGSSNSVSCQSSKELRSAGLRRALAAAVTVRADACGR